MRTAALLGFFALAASAAAAPVTREQLAAMARDGVDPAVMKAIVERDCVDFDVDAGNAAELSRLLPPAVLEAAIACRRNAGSRASASASAPKGPEGNPGSPGPSAGAEAAAPTSAPAAPAPGPSNVPPPAAPVASAPSAAISPGSSPEGRIRLRAFFIGESDALRCAAAIDGKDAATLVKEAQGRFGEAVERTKIARESAYVPVAPGRHRVVFRCDPHARSVSADVEVAAGESRTVEIGETMFRRWKLRRITAP